jgi:hypothetical protein
MSYLVRAEQILLPDCGQSVRFDFPIGDVVETKQALVICLRVGPGRYLRDNVWAIDHQGRILWRSRTGRKSPYVGVTLEEKSASEAGPLVWLHNRDGSKLLVEAKSGKVIETS